MLSAACQKPQFYFRSRLDSRPQTPSAPPLVTKNSPPATERPAAEAKAIRWLNQSSVACLPPGEPSVPQRLGGGGVLSPENASCLSLLGDARLRQT